MKRSRILFATLAAMSAGASSLVEAGLALEACRISAGPGFPSSAARCGVLQRPEDPSDPGSPVLSLTVAVVPALSLEPEADPFVPIAGGPGQSTIEFYSLMPQAFERIRRNRDIVLLDQRGTGTSARMDCDIGEEIVDGRLSPEQTIAVTEDCLETLPHRPEFFTTSVAVSDLEALRLALGAPALNVYGISYGTRVAQHYARRYPDAVRSIILDGVVPPQLALGPGIAIEADKALRKIFRRCAESAQCNGRFPSIGEEFEALEKRLSSGEVSVALPHPLTGQSASLDFGTAELAIAIRLLSYSPQTVALMPLLIHEAAHGNLPPLASQYLMVVERLSDALAIGMHNAVVCTEDAPFWNPENPAREALNETYIGTLQLDALLAICSVWPAGILDLGFKQALAFDRPALLLSGDADPVTPPNFAELAAVDLENALLLTGENQGHGQAATGCMADVMGRFVEELSTDARALDPAGCLARRTALPFFLDFTGPTP